MSRALHRSPSSRIISVNLYFKVSVMIDPFNRPLGGFLMALHEALNDGYIPSRADSPQPRNGHSTDKARMQTTEQDKSPVICMEAYGGPLRVEALPPPLLQQSKEPSMLPNTFVEVTRQLHQGAFNPLFSSRAPFPAFKTDMFSNRGFDAGECSSHEQKRYNENMWNVNEGFDRLPINDNLFQENMPPANFSQDFEDGSEDLMIDRGALETWFDQLQDRVLIGLCHGPHPSMEALKSWVDFPYLLVDYYPWLKNLGAKIGKVLGQKSRGGINPKWDPQLLIEVNLSKPLKNDISIKDSHGHLWHSQRIVYRNLPNSCFKCHAQGHQIKDCPEMETNKANKQGDEDKEKKGVFQQIPKKPLAKGLKLRKEMDSNLTIDLRPC
ncbi:hypothetical protein L7F22_002944 [Adiantum nelumboides]|nr:hypothetical protein [Adiantum nelumboides]